MLKELRQKRGLSRKALAEKAGLSPEYVKLIEAGQRRNVGTDVIGRVCMALDLGPEERLGLFDSLIDTPPTAISQDPA